MQYGGGEGIWGETTNYGVYNVLAHSLNSKKASGAAIG